MGDKQVEKFPIGENKKGKNNQPGKENEIGNEKKLVKKRDKIRNKLVRILLYLLNTLRKKLSKNALMGYTIIRNLRKDLKLLHLWKEKRK